MSDSDHVKNEGLLFAILIVNTVATVLAAFTPIVLLMR